MAVNSTNKQNCLIAELHRLRGMGLEVVPVKDKESLVQFKNRPSLPTSKIEDFIRLGKATGLGLRLGTLTVVDIDDPDPSWESRVKARFGETDVRVRTPSGGIHLYYAGQLEHPPNLKAEGWPVDIKTGRNQYVVSAGSWRDDGGAYRVDGTALGEGPLPQIRDNDTSPMPQHRQQKGAIYPRSSAVPGTVVPVGQRHSYLLGQGQKLARSVKSKENMLVALQRVFEAECDTSVPLEIGELEGIAEWCWQLQQAGRNFLPGESYVPIKRWILERLRGDSRAQHLAAVICQLHGREPDKAFCLDHKGMRDAGWTDLGRDGFRKAVRALVDRGIVHVAKQYIKATKKTRYKLSPTPPASNLTIS